MAIPWDGLADPWDGNFDRRPVRARRRPVFKAEKPWFLHIAACGVLLLPLFVAKWGRRATAISAQREPRREPRPAGVARNVRRGAQNAEKGLRKRKARRHAAAGCVQNGALSALFRTAGVVIIFWNFAPPPPCAAGGAGRNKRRVRARGRRFFPTFARLNSGYSKQST